MGTHLIPSKSRASVPDRRRPLCARPLCDSRASRAATEALDLWAVNGRDEGLTLPHRCAYAGPRGEGRCAPTVVPWIFSAPASERDSRQTRRSDEARGPRSEHRERAASDRPSSRRGDRSHERRRRVLGEERERLARRPSLDPARLIEAGQPPDVPAMLRQLHTHGA